MGNNYWIKPHQIYNISRTLVGNKIVDHTNEVGALTVNLSNYIFISDLTPNFNGLQKNNFKKKKKRF